MKINLRAITEDITSLAVVALLSGGATYWFCSSHYEPKLQEANEKIAKLKEAEQDARVTKRISEQMEDIAFEQKTLSDRQRERAEEQSRIADIERGKAEMERSLAQKAERIAVISARQADSMRIVAETESERAVMHMKQAQQARAQADTLFYISLARSLAQNSVTQFYSGDRELATLLSYSSWYFTDAYGGNPYMQDVFTALLKTAPDAQSNVCHLIGNIRKLMLCGGTDNEARENIIWKDLIQNKGMDALKAVRPFIAVTDYGEVVRLSVNEQDNGGSYTIRQLMKDNTRVFRDACMVKDRIYLLDTKGIILSVDANGSETNREKLQTPHINLNNMGKSRPGNKVLREPFATDVWMHLEQMKGGNLMAAGKRQLAWVNPQSGEVLKTYRTDNEITALGTCEDLTLVFCKNGELISFNEEMQPVNGILQMPKQHDVTYYYYQKDARRHYIGTDIGDIFLYDHSGKYLTTLFGHSGRITGIDLNGPHLVSSSYDKNVCIWDITDITALMSPIKIGFIQWPLCFALDKPAQTLRVGLANGNIETVRISVANNRASTHKNITREFTPQEWDYYIGNNVPFINFKQQ